MDNKKLEEMSKEVTNAIEEAFDNSMNKVAETYEKEKKKWEEQLEQRNKEKEFLEGKVVSLEAKGTPSPNRRARRRANKPTEGIHAQEIISFEERQFRNRKKKLAKQSKKKNR